MGVLAPGAGLRFRHDLLASPARLERRGWSQSHRPGVEAEVDFGDVYAHAKNEQGNG
ncbi:hypothetical protein [Streptomyces chiangmaiensis]|uniref:Uncharacterized protein n=1 Tax=Streptomyces chiangmaiensis TaxID=766497 RepID=A0ABU7FTC0_9ACTN|nr:hypothetical protein [Streptomyces chiangmaiensis]MED7827360.1 hypothetical protein [Streptomyces chiangmaiensis]